MESVLDFIILFDCFQLCLHVSPQYPSGALWIRQRCHKIIIKGFFADSTRCGSGSKIGIEDDLCNFIHFAYFEREFYNVGLCFIDFIDSWYIFHVYQVKCLQSAACKTAMVLYNWISVQRNWMNSMSTRAGGFSAVSVFVSVEGYLEASEWQNIERSKLLFMLKI